MIKTDPQLTFGMMEDAELPQAYPDLDKINAIIDWQPIEKEATALYARDFGRPAIPPLVMIKIVFLQHFYDLNDVQVSRDIHDRRSFERFLGPDVRRYVIDDSSVARFRARLIQANMDERLMKMIHAQIVAHGFFLRNAKNVTVIDASLRKAATSAYSRKKDGTPVDPDVHVTSRKDRLIDGMKMHVCGDASTELIEDVRLTTIETSDHEVFEELIPADAHVVTADKAYGSAKHRAWLAERKIDDRLMYKGARNHPLTQEQKECNRRVSPVRSIIERIIANVKNRCSLKRLRYIGLRKNLFQVRLSCCAYNIKRLVVLC